MKNSSTLRGMRFLGLAGVLTAAFLVGSCDDSDDIPSGTQSPRTFYTCGSCINAPEAMASNDNLSSGVYKGVFSGGSLLLDVKNNDNLIDGKLYIGNRIINVKELYSYTDKDEFVAILNGNVEESRFSMVMRVKQDGTNPRVDNFILPNHSAVSAAGILKERSTSLLEVFRGKYFVKDADSSSGSNPFTERTDGSGSTGENIRDVGAIELIVSRADNAWISMATMNGAASGVMDRGSIIDGRLVSDLTHKVKATLVNDELNNLELATTNGKPLYMSAVRIR